MIKRNGYVDPAKLSPADAARRKALLEGRMLLGDADVPGPDTFSGARLELRHDPNTERWTVVLVSRTTKEDVVVAWKQTEADARAWAENYGVRP